MRILHLLSQTEMTGSEAYAQTLAQAQQAAGHQIFVISDHLHLPFPALYLPLSISTASFFKRMQNIFELRQFLIENKIDVVHCHSRAACRHAAWARHRLSIAMVTTLHGFQHASFSKRLFNIYGDTVFAVCEKIQEQLTGAFKMDPAQVRVLRNPMDFYWGESQHQQKTIALIGRASGPKGARLKELFRDQVSSWLGIHPEAKVTLALSGLTASEKAELQKLVPSAQQDRVTITGDFLDLKTVFQTSFCVVASGRIAIEAFAFGCEVIALGEASLEGRLSSETLPFGLASNFGDVGPEKILDPSAVTHLIRNVIRSPLTKTEREKVKVVLEQEFSKPKICAAVEESYRSARLLRVARALPILMYHKVPDQEIPSRHKIYVSRDNFEKHLLFFQSQGFTTLTFDDLRDFWFEKRPLKDFPAKPLVLTFDDGYLDNLTNAAPLLEKYGMKATLFLLADHSIIQNTWDETEAGVDARLIDLEQKKALPAQVYGIGSHGLEHVDLRKISNDDVLKQMRVSKQKLEQDLGRSVVAFAYPFGHVDSRLPRLAQQAGYDFAVNTDRGALRWVDDRHSLFRINIFPHESWFSLWRKTSSWYRRSYFKKRGQ
ncbi:MAG: polysaccharide deacetylase family protein [Bdellovibrio sp.]